MAQKKKTRKPRSNNKNDILKAISRQFKDLTKQMDQKFEKVDKRFEDVNQHFKGVDRKFEDVNQHFKGVDQKFEKVDKRFEDVNQHFKGVDQKFEKVDKRFEDVNQHFKGIDRKFEDARKDMLRLFEEERPKIKEETRLLLKADREELINDYLAPMFEDTQEKAEKANRIIAQEVAKLSSKIERLTDSNIHFNDEIREQKQKTDKLKHEVETLKKIVTLKTI